MITAPLREKKKSIKSAVETVQRSDFANKAAKNSPQNNPTSVTSSASLSSENGFAPFIGGCFVPGASYYY